MPPHGFRRLILALWLVLLAAPASAQQPALCRQGLTGTSKCVTPWDQPWIPSGIPATKIGAGTVDNTVFGYLVGLTGPIEARLPPTPSAIGRLVVDNGPGNPYGSVGPSITPGYVLTSQGAGVAPSFQPPITSVDSDCTTLGAAYAVPGTTYTSTGLFRTLTRAGKWRITGNIRMQLIASVGTGSLSVQLHNGTSAIAGSHRISGYSASSVISGGTYPIDIIVSVGGVTVVTLQAAQAAGATYPAASIESDPSGETILCSEQIG